MALAMTAVAPPPSSALPDASARRAFEHAYATHHDFVRRTLRSLGVSDAAADDLTQDVFMVVHRRLPDFDHAAPVKAWIFGIARNLARKYHERRPPSAPLSVARDAVVDDCHDPDAALARRQAARVVESFLGSLDENKRVVFVLAELEGMTAPEVAASAGIKLNTVYSRLRVARALFDKAIARARARQQRPEPPTRRARSSP